MEMVVSLQSAWMGVKRRMQLRCNYALVIAAAAPPHCPPEPKPGRGNQQQQQQQQSQKVGSEAHAAKQWMNGSGKRKENLLNAFFWLIRKKGGYEVRLVMGSKRFDTSLFDCKKIGLDAARSATDGTW